MLGVTVSTTLSGRSIAGTGRYQRFPVAGLALMTAALAPLAADPSRLATGVGLTLFGLWRDRRWRPGGVLVAAALAGLALLVVLGLPELPPKTAPRRAPPRRGGSAQARSER
jgi:predicted N-acetyltransferase YhbS